MQKRLSIIIPCYNSSTTLAEAVHSCYQQELDSRDFEVILVDDGSTDGTRELMSRLSNQYDNIRLIFHDHNQGGGAARNTGIGQSNGEIIYCLDSDNFFAPKTVLTMIQYLEERQLDGVAFYERRFFVGNKTSKYSTHINAKLSENISISDIFSIKNHILLDNFFFKKSAYLKTAGYPEHHGFDTQCFELRFLASGNQVQVCPNTIFYHRQDKKHNSYFQRVYKDGHFSLNYYLIAEDIIHLLNDNVVNLIMNFDVFGHAELNPQNLKAQLDGIASSQVDDFFIGSYQSFLNQDGQRLWQDQYKESKKPVDIFKMAVISSNKNRYAESIDFYTKLLTIGTDSPLIYFNLMRAEIGLTNKLSNRDKEKRTLEIIKKLSPQTQVLGTRQKLLKILLQN